MSFVLLFYCFCCWFSYRIHLLHRMDHRRQLLPILLRGMKAHSATHMKVELNSNSGGSNCKPHTSIHATVESRVGQFWEEQNQFYSSGIRILGVILGNFAQGTKISIFAILYGDLSRGCLNSMSEFYAETSGGQSFIWT